MLSRNLFAIVILALLASPMAMGASERWGEDVEFLAATLPERHANLFHQLSSDQFSAELNQLRSRLGSLSDAQVVLELARILAKVGDGHTQLNLGQAGTGFRLLPVVLGQFEDGLYVLMSAPAHADLLGAKLLKFGDVPAEVALDKVANYISGDNEMSALYLGPSRLTMVEVLEELGAAPSEGPIFLELTLPDGTQRTQKISPLELSSYQEIEWQELEHKTPVHSGTVSDNYWYDFLDSNRALFIKYNRCENQDGYSLKKFGSHIWKELQEKKPRTIVVDLRRNGGGDQSLNKYLIKPLQRYKQQKQVEVVGIIGRGTFSAAVEFAIQMERQLNATFIGEPTRGKPNHYGESGTLKLPYSGLSVGFSEKYYQLSDADDARPWIAPDTSTSRSFDEYVAGQDSAVEAALGRGQ